MKFITAEDVKYTEQQEALDEIAGRLGVVAYRPDYHGAKGDKNTVLFYTQGDEEHNREVDRQPVHYSASEAKDLGWTVPEEQVYRDAFWSFENSDANNQLDMGFANFGKVDLRSIRWREALEGYIHLALTKKCQYAHVRSCGGYLEMREADNINNDLNRETITALKQIYGELYLGDINFYDEKRKKIQTGQASVYEEYTGQMVYNFGCDFAVPEKDEELEKMIREWNTDIWPANTKLVPQITARIEALGGISFVWF